MNKIISFLAVIMGVLCLTGSAFAANADASAKLVTAISILKDTGAVNGGDLAFGRIIPGLAGASVTISPYEVAAFSRSIGGSCTLIGIGGNDYGPATFSVTGAQNATYTITIPVWYNESIITSRTNNSNTMIVDHWSCNKISQSTLNEFGDDTFKVGGILHVNTSQADGEYTGTFLVTVAYN